MLHVGVDPRMSGRSITILHLSDLQFGPNHRFAGIDLAGLSNPYDTLLGRLWEDLQALHRNHDVQPDLVIVTGDLAEKAMPDEFRAARDFLEKLTDENHLNLPRQRVAIVPGNHDVSRKACSAYFDNCEGDGTRPLPPWSPKWRQYTAMFQEFYRGASGVDFSPEEQWSLFEMPELKVVIAGLNSTMVEGHDCPVLGQPPDRELPRHVGWIGEEQLRWFAKRLSKRREEGWLRIGALHHNWQRGCKADDENLEDAAELTRVLGPELNLLLHGHTHQAALAWIDPHVPVISTGSAAVISKARPEEVPNQYHVIQISAGHLRRFGRAFIPEDKTFGPDARIGKNGGQVDQDVAFKEVFGAFPGETHREEHRERLPRGREEIERDDFLERVAQLCKMRQQTAEVTAYRRDGERPSYLRVVERGDTFTRVYPVGIFENGLTREDLKAFVDTVDARYRGCDRSLVSEIVCGGDRPPEDLAREAGHSIRVRSFVEYQGLIDFRDYVRTQTERLENDSLYPPPLYVPQRMRFHIGADQGETDDAFGQIQSWLVQPHGRFVVILGDFGMGKTFLLRELARRMGHPGNTLTPVFVELRALEKAPTLDILIAQHLAKAGMERIDLPAFRHMLRHGRIVLFFDGFDELALRVSYDRAVEHLETLVQAAEGDAKVVLTSRTQHFESDEQVRTVLYKHVQLLPGLRYCKLRPFTDTQIHQFLLNRWQQAPDPQAEASDWLALLRSVKDLIGLSDNPRMLGFIAELPKARLKQAARQEGAISAAELYRLLIEQWLNFEFERAHPRGAQELLSREARWAAVTAIALRLWEKTEKYLSIAEIAEVAHPVVAKTMTTPPPADIATHLIGSGSLLRRDDQNGFFFVHQSVMEWLVANEAARQIQKSGDSQLLATRAITLLMAEFLCDLVGRERAIEWARTVVGRVGDGSELARSNALEVLGRLKATATLRLTGQDLRGRDFAGQSLVGADLSGADLSDARLAGQDLTGVNLEGARLVRADLTRTKLGNARMAKADLTEARLAGADLGGADLTGASLRRAVLVGARLARSTMQCADLLGAAMPEDTNAMPHVPSGQSWCTCVAWQPGLGLLASGHVDGTVRIWDPASNKQISLLRAHRDPVLSIAFSPDGKSLASASEDNTGRIWDLASNERISLLGHQGCVFSVAFSPDGKFVASASDDNTTRIWDLASNKQISLLEGHIDSVRSVAFSPDGKSLASASDDETVRIWDLVSSKQVSLLEGHKESVRSAAFSPDGRFVASAGDDESVRIWDLLSSKQVSLLEGHRDSVGSVAFSPDGRSVASGSDDGTVRIWDPSSKQVSVLKGHQDYVRSVAFSPDGRSVASGSDDGTVRIWDPTSSKQVSLLKGHQQCVLTAAFSPDGKSLASTSDDKTVRIWDLASSKQVSLLEGHQGYIRSVAFSPDGKSVVSGSDDKTVRIWDLASSKQVCLLEGHQDYVSSVAFSPDGRSVASGSDDWTVRVWDPSSKQVSVLKGHRGYVRGVVFSPDGKSLASGSDDKTVRIWDPTSSKQVSLLQGHQDSVRSIAFSPDGKSLASASYDETVRIWDIASNEQTSLLQGHKEVVRSVAFSADGKSLASASADRTIRIWDRASSKEISLLKGHQNSVGSVAFSPDGKSLASASADNTVRIWDVENGECLVILASSAEGWVAYTPQGRYKLAGNVADWFWHTINLCRFEPGELDEFMPGLRIGLDEPFPRISQFSPEAANAKGPSITGAFSQR